MTIFAEITKNECTKYRHSLSKSIIYGSQYCTISGKRCQIQCKFLIYYSII